MSDLVDVRIRLQTALLGLTHALATAESIRDDLPPDLVTDIALAKRATAELVDRLIVAENRRLARGGR